MYSAESERQDNNGSFPAGNIAIASDYYWSQQIPGMEGKKLRIDGWRPNTLPRTVNVDKDSYRFLAGLRGTTALELGLGDSTSILKVRIK